MLSKEAFRLIVNATALKTGKSQEELALGMGYGKNYISEVLSPTGKLTDKFIKAFKAAYSEPSENPKNGFNSRPDDLLVQLMQKQNSLMEMQNRILKEMKEGVQDRVVNIEKDLKKVDSNLENALGFAIRLETFSEAARTVILESLARLEKKPEGSLIGEVNKMIRPSSGL